MPHLKLIFILLATTFSFFTLANPRIITALSTCSLETIPENIIVSSSRASLKNGESITYKITVKDPGTYDVVLRDGILPNCKPKDVGCMGMLAFEDLNTDKDNMLVDKNDYFPKFEISSTTSKNDLETLSSGVHIVKVFRHQSTPSGKTIDLYCTPTYKILEEQETKQVTCDIKGPAEANISTQVEYSGTITPVGKYRFKIFGTNNFQRYIPDELRGFTIDSNRQFQFSLGTFVPGTYNIKLQKYIISNQSGSNASAEWQDIHPTSCSIKPLVIQSISDNPNPNTSLITVGSGQASGPNPNTYNCTGSGCTSAAGIACNINDGGTKIQGETDESFRLRTPTDKLGVMTAIGCVPTEPMELVKGLFRLALGVSGGIALLLMIFGGFLMITSAGNPDSLKKGHEQFTSAIIGLLFVIFSILLLQIIGVNILNLPGFVK